MKSVNIVVIGAHTSAYLMRCERLPGPGEYLIAKEYVHNLDGGKGSNQAIAAARLGADVALVSAVGNDEKGRFALNYLENEGIDIGCVHVSNNLPTGTGIAFIDTKGTVIGATDMGASREITYELINRAVEKIKYGDILLVQLEIPIDTALYACKTAKEFGLTVIMNPAPADGIVGRKMENVDIITPNEPEAKLLAGLNPGCDIDIHELGRKVSEATGVEYVIITLGEKGALLVVPESTVYVPCPCVNTVDTSGAGDSFNASLAFALGNGLCIEKAVNFAVLAATFTVSKSQVWTAYPTLQDIENCWGIKMALG